MPEFKLLRDGSLEIFARGSWRIIPGCSCRGIFEFSERLAELTEIISQSSPDELIESLYRTHQRFRYLCDRILELNGCDPDWIRSEDLGWLLFGWVDDDSTAHVGAFIQLNELPEPRRPRKKTTLQEEPSDFVMLLAAIASLPDTSLEEAYRIATSIPAREALGVIDEIAWAGISDEEKSNLKFRAQADKFRQQFGGNYNGN